MRKSLILVVWTVLLLGCKENGQESPGVVVANAFGEDLYRSEISSIIPATVNQLDSAKMAQAYINSWVKNRTVLANAKRAFTEEDSELESKVEEYRNSLLIYNFERSWVDQKLDTVVNLDSISAYYEQNRDKFKLKDNMLKLAWFSMPADLGSPDKNSLLKLFRSQDPEDKSTLEKKLAEMGVAIEDYDSSWMRFKLVAVTVPVTLSDMDRSERDRTWWQEKNDRLYFVHLNEVRKQAQEAPLELVKGEVKAILLNKRKAQLLDNMKNDLFNDAKKKGEIQIN